MSFIFPAEEAEQDLEDDLAATTPPVLDEMTHAPPLPPVRPLQQILPLLWHR
jgi:hypothetical protein